MADHIRETVEQTVKESQRMRTDIFNFGQAINRKSPRAWKELQANWEQFFPGMEVQVAVDVSVRRIGMNRFPASLPEKERPKR
ncbi:MAG: Ger(x)C family spore germination C-terminal domain-containing protein [Paenibacillus macerans]|nr:Ger(x)C family spore germination C-terminal domain-containing protein [Paenibacillus macerans]MBS5910254.1 Ger(x)C family spore germination C-terminal domain-containing protein [Paenibacillus macerans]MDU5948589.1 Ger(x)C family spore germination C-terminal domain-containing protein [Paenibacillus macerans]